MPCEDLEHLLFDKGEAAFSEEARKHLAGCAACQETARTWARLRDGFAAMSADSPPEASVGFTERVLRKLVHAAEERDSATAFIERVGRRVVLATLVAALALLLAVALPPTGPVRGADEVMPSGDTELLTAEMDPVGAFQGAESRGPSQRTETRATEKGRK